MLLITAAVACHAWRFIKLILIKLKFLQLKAFPQSNCHVCIKNHQHEKSVLYLFMPIYIFCRNQNSQRGHLIIAFQQQQQQN